jgi:hypothetical protein
MSCHVIGDRRREGNKRKQERDDGTKARRRKKEEGRKIMKRKDEEKDVGACNSHWLECSSGIAPLIL